MNQILNSKFAGNQPRKENSTFFTLYYGGKYKLVTNTP